MTEIAIIVILWAILYIIAFVFLPAWRKRHDADKGLYARSQDDNKLSVNYALKQMNCKVKWMEDHGDLVARYAYQGGHFNIRLEKDSPYIRLSFFYFFETVPHHLELVREVCNQCNLNTETCRVVYTINDETAVIDMHIVCSLMVTDNTVKEVLERAMGNTFKWQNVFIRRFNELLPDHAKTPGQDAEKDAATLQHETFLLREMEMTHQNTEFDGHQGQDNVCRLGQLLNAAMGLTDIVPAHFVAYDDKGRTVLDDTDDILNFDISRPLISEGTFRSAAALARLDFYDPRDPVKMRHLTLDFEQEDATHDTLFYRITLSLAPVAPCRSVETSVSRAPKRQVSVLLGYDLTPPEERLKKFRYLWKEAQAKVSSGNTGELSEDERTLVNMQSPDVGIMVYNARMLFEQKRFYEAIGWLERIYGIVATKTEGHKQCGKRERQTLYFMLGVCYGCLRQYEKAIYYLQQTEPFANQEGTEAYVNCLVNQKDHRALHIIDNLINFLRETTSQSDDEESRDKPKLQASSAQVEHIYCFLLRRKAYLLVATKNYDEAERLLKQMLNNPKNSDFALRELAYIQRNREKQTDG